MQQQIRQQLTDPHNHNLFVQFREVSLYWRTLQQELAEDAEDSSVPTGLEELVPLSLK